MPEKAGGRLLGRLKARLVNWLLRGVEVESLRVREFKVGDRTIRVAADVMELKSLAADSTNTTRDSPPIELKGAYWDGSASADVTARERLDVTSTNPAADWVLEIQGLPQVRFTYDAGKTPDTYATTLESNSELYGQRITFGAPSGYEDYIAFIRRGMYGLFFYTYYPGGSIRGMLAFDPDDNEVEPGEDLTWTLGSADHRWKRVVSGECKLAEVKDSAPSAEEGLMYVRTIDADNDGLYIYLKKSGTVQEVSVAGWMWTDCPECGKTVEVRRVEFGDESMRLKLFCGHEKEVRFK